MSSLIHQLDTNLLRIEELLIDFRELIGEHSGENMAEAVWQTLELYDLVGRVNLYYLSMYFTNAFTDHRNCNG